MNRVDVWVMPSYSYHISGRVPRLLPRQDEEIDFRHVSYYGAVREMVTLLSEALARSHPLAKKGLS